MSWDYDPIKTKGGLLVSLKAAGIVQEMGLEPT